MLHRFRWTDCSEHAKYNMNTGMDEPYVKNNYNDMGYIYITHKIIV